MNPIATISEPVASAVRSPDSGPVLTIADVARLPRTLATTDVDYELHDGRLVVMAPPGANHGRGQARICTFLLAQGEQPGHGQAFAKVGVLLRRNPDHLLGADAAFLTNAQLPPQLSPEGFLLTIPQLVVEIRSKNNTPHEMDAKVREYLAAGAVIVWIADPDARTITVHCGNQPSTTFSATDTLTANPVIPGFAVLVADLLPA